MNWKDLEHYIKVYTDIIKDNDVKYVYVALNNPYYTEILEQCRKNLSITYNNNETFQIGELLMIGLNNDKFKLKDYEAKIIIIFPENSIHYKTKILNENERIIKNIIE
jgi:hypothetical protein